MSDKTTTTVTIGEIDTKPAYDPMQNIGGMTTYTELHLDCETGEVWVSQEMNDNGVPIRWWHGHVRYCKIMAHPIESNLRSDLEDWAPVMQRICDGYESYWNGNNHVARFTEDAMDAWYELSDHFGSFYDGEQGYEYYELEEWLYPAMQGTITADTSDDEIAQCADEWMIADAHIVVNGDRDDAIRYISDYRDTLRHERDAYD